MKPAKPAEPAAYPRRTALRCYNQKLPSLSPERLVRSTTVLCVRRDGHVVLAGDGQVTLGEGVIKHTAKKIRRLYQDKILAGFAGSTADAFALFSRFETRKQGMKKTVYLTKTNAM